MNEFINSFMQIDSDGDGRIALNELRMYAKRNKLDSSLATKWKELFDLENTGIITLENFLKVLGVKMQDYVEMREQNLQSTNNRLKLGMDVQVIKADIPLVDQIDITNEIRRLIKADKDDTDHQLAVAIKAFLDLHYGRTWHVVIVDGSLRIAFTHFVDNLFFFNMFDLTFIIWRTPDF